VRLTGEEIDTAAMQLWREVFAAQCSLPRGDNEPSRHVFYAECVADGAEETFRERCAKENK
jgi:hypothetical protein